MRASSCRPPTARPGLSMHERGLAVDLTQGGSTLRRSSSGYRWLKANAHKYGFFNLPSEPWHWSVNGN
jgi:LAS superfamily LD-carboxypeptidase LdcB